MSIVSGMEWSGGVACSGVTDGVASCITAGTVFADFLPRRRFPHRQAFLAVSVLCVSFPAEFLTKAARSFASADPTDSAALAKPVLCASFGIRVLRHSYRTFLPLGNTAKTFLPARCVSRVSEAFFFLPLPAVMLVLPPHQNETQVNTRTKRNGAVNPKSTCIERKLSTPFASRRYTCRVRGGQFQSCSKRETKGSRLVLPALFP